MAQLPETAGPTTSYSDPFYDRLESVAQRISRRIGLVLLAIAVAVAVAVVVHSRMGNSPAAASANSFLSASTQREQANRERDPLARGVKQSEAAKAFATLAADEQATPYFRARACIELTQDHLDHAALTEAKAQVAKAKEFAAKADDPDLDLAIGLSQAAVELQAGEHAAAEKTYLGVERAAGATYPDRQIAALLGATIAMAAQSRVDDAIAKLEPLMSRVDGGSASLLIGIAKQQYWKLKRQKAEGVAPAAPAPAAPTTGAAAPPPPSVAAPAAPVPPSIAPVVPATPEGGK